MDGTEHGAAREYPGCSALSHAERGPKAFRALLCTTLLQGRRGGRAPLLCGAPGTTISTDSGQTANSGCGDCCLAASSADWGSRLAGVGEDRGMNSTASSHRLMNVADPTMAELQLQCPQCGTSLGT